PQLSTLSLHTLFRSPAGPRRRAALRAPQLLLLVVALRLPRVDRADLAGGDLGRARSEPPRGPPGDRPCRAAREAARRPCGHARLDRKSPRLNSSHVA